MLTTDTELSAVKQASNLPETSSQTQTVQSSRPDTTCASIEAVDVVIRRFRFFKRADHGIEARGTFNAQAFLDSAGVARTIVEYRRADVIFKKPIR